MEEYAGIIQPYIRYVCSHFGSQCTVVFDSYVSGSSIKDHKHKAKIAPVVLFQTECNTSDFSLAAF